MNIKYAKDKQNLEWGEIKTEDILKRLYKKKPLAAMSDTEIDRMLEDLI